MVQSYASETLTVILLATFLFFIGRLMHLAIGRDAPSRKVHGQWIASWVCAMTLGTGLSALILMGPSEGGIAPASTLAALCGLPAGLAFGWIHGWARLFAASGKKSKNSVGEGEDLNPYRPPTNVSDS